MGKLDEHEKKNLEISPEHKGKITEKEVEEIYREASRRLEWKYGKGWLDSREDKEMNELIIEKFGEVSDDYYERIAREEMIDKIADLIVKCEIPKNK